AARVLPRAPAVEPGPALRPALSGGVDPSRLLVESLRAPGASLRRSATVGTAPEAGRELEDWLGAQYPERLIGKYSALSRISGFRGRIRRKCAPRRSDRCDSRSSST